MAIYDSASEILTAPLFAFNQDAKTKEILEIYLGKNWLSYHISQTPNASLSLLLGESIPYELISEILSVSEGGKEKPRAILKFTIEKKIRQRAEQYQREKDAIGKFYFEHIRIKNALKNILSALDKLDECLSSPSNEYVKKLSENLKNIISLLNSHYLQEEKHLFQTLQARHNYTGEPLGVIVYEHKLIQSRLKVLEKLHAIFKKNGTTALCSLRLHFIVFLSLVLNHVNKEEKVIFPLADEVLTESEKLSLFNKLVQQ